MTQHAKRLPRRIGNRRRDRRPEIDVACATDVHAAKVQVTNGQTRIRKQLTLDAETSLLDVRLRVIFREQVQTRIHTAGSRRCAENVWIDGTRIRNQRAIQAHARHLDSVLRMRGAEHDRGRASEEDSVTAAHDCLLVKRITESETRSKVVAIAHRSRGVQTYPSQSSTRIVHRRIREILKVVAQTEIQRQLRTHAPVVLNEKTELIQVGMRLRSGGTRAA